MERTGVAERAGEDEAEDIGRESDAETAANGNDAAAGAATAVTGEMGVTSGMDADAGAVAEWVDAGCAVAPTVARAEASAACRKS